jgi:hypothetical protein
MTLTINCCHLSYAGPTRQLQCAEALPKLQRPAKAGNALWLKPVLKLAKLSMLLTESKCPDHSSIPLYPLNRWPRLISVLFLIIARTISNKALQTSSLLAFFVTHSWIIPVSQPEHDGGHNAGGPKTATDFGGKLFRLCFDAPYALLPCSLNSLSMYNS